MKILLWVILIIFLIGLLVVTGVFKMIFGYVCPAPRRANVFTLHSVLRLDHTGNIRRRL